MHIGLHIDPRHMTDISILMQSLDEECGVPIFELIVQSSMGAGARPLIRRYHYDCEPPPNIDDIQLEDLTLRLNLLSNLLVRLCR
jgi:hypothetical protein